MLAALRSAVTLVRIPRLLVVLLLAVVGPASLAFAQEASRPSSAAVVAARLTVQAAVAEALARNPDLLAARAGVTMAGADLVIARQRANPVLGLGADHLDLLGTGFNDENGAGPPEYSARIDVLLERGGKRARRIETAREGQAIADADLLDATRTLTLAVQQTFVDLQLAQEDNGLARENAAALDEVVTLDEARVRSGDLAEVELLRGRIAALQAWQAVRAAELEVQSQRRQLARLMGRGASGAAFEIEPFVPPAARHGPVDDLRARALQHRPDLGAMRRALARAQAETRLRIAQGRIDLTLGAEYRRQQGLAGRGNSLGLFASVPLPLFDRNQGGVARARGEAQQVEARLRRLEQDVVAEVDLAAAQADAALAARTMVEGRMVEEARAVRETTDYTYRRGEVTMMVFLDAQRAFNETMQARNEARAEYARSFFLLRAAVGEEPVP